MARNNIDLEATRAQATWTELMKQMSQRQLRNALKSGYRKANNEALKIARQKLGETSLHVMGNTGDWKRGVRGYIYSKGGGFMATVKGRGQKSMHVNRRGKEKPVLMWAEEGTKPRKRRNGGNSGHMRAYNFMRDSEAAMYRKVEEVLAPELEKAVYRAAQKAGLV